MTPERVLTLDISTKTGWNLMISEDSGPSIEACGQISKIEEPTDEAYPSSFVAWAYLCYEKILELVEQHTPDVLVIEETAGNSKNSHSQKILEFIHFLVAKLIRETGIKSIYLMTGQWRSETGCKMLKSEKEHNKDVAKYKEKNDTKVAYGKDGKRIGRINKKHVAIRRANEEFGKFFKEPLRKKDEDLADSLMIALCYHLRRVKQETK